MKHFSLSTTFVQGYYLTIQNFGLFLAAYGLRAALWIVGVVVLFRYGATSHLVVEDVHDVFSPIPFSLPSLEQLQSAELHTLITTALITGIMMVLDSFFVLGLNKMALRLTTQGTSSLSELWSSSLSLFIRMAVLNLIYGFMVAIGTLCFIIPGILVAALYSFSFIYLIDHDAQPLQALSGSRRLTRGNVLHIIAFFILSALINFVGMIPFGLGTLFTGPLTLCAQIVAYRTLSTK